MLLPNDGRNSIRKWEEESAYKLSRAASRGFFVKRAENPLTKRDEYAIMLSVQRGKAING